jgi:hypothetical protein
MNIDLTSLFPDLEALTPDGRWNMLQDWLANNPEYGKRVDKWSTQSTDQVFVEIRDLIAKRFGISTNLVSLLTVGREQQIRRTIEVMQACYRERAGQTETQLKSKKRRLKKNEQK